LPAAEVYSELNIKKLNPKKPNTKMTKTQLKSIYEAESKGLFYFANTYVKDSDKAKDIVQSAFIKLWENRSRVENPKAFLKKSIVNISLNTIRTDKNRAAREQFYIDEERLNEINIENFSSKNTKVTKLLNQLSEDIRKTIILKCVNELKYTEIAEELGVPVNTVKSRLKVGYRKMREGVSML
jgi:RNA polymerase sigma-70 factor (ECF subfamily)